MATTPTVDVLIHNAAKLGGWDSETIIEVLTDYIENQMNNDTFAEYLANRLHDELLP